MKSKTIILAGSGHAHLEIIKALSKDEILNNRYILVSPHSRDYYSGLIPRLIAGEIDVPKLTINSAEFAERKGIQFVQDSLKSFDQKANSITLTSGRTECFDLLSIDIGGSRQRIPSESPFNTVYMRPFDEFIERWREVQRICSTCISPRFVVVGGGAAAVEVATALRIRLKKNGAFKSEVHLVTQSSRLCEGYSEEISGLISASASEFGIQVHFQEPVTKILDKYIVLRSGAKLPFDSIFLATPTEPAAFLPGEVDATLRLGSNIFAVGDCTKMTDHPHLPRSGVIAVHQGRHLAKSIRAMLNNEDPSEFVPRKRLLNILISGDERAHLIWGKHSVQGKVPLQIKNWIDERYMKSFS